MGCGRSNSISQVSNPVSVSDNRNISVSKEQTTYVKLQIPKIPITQPNTEPQNLQRAATSVSSIAPSVTPSKVVPPAPINKVPQAVLPSPSITEVPPSNQARRQTESQVALEAIVPEIVQEAKPAPLTCIINYDQPKSKFRAIYCSKEHIICRQCVPLYFCLNPSAI